MKTGASYFFTDYDALFRKRVNYEKTKKAKEKYHSISVCMSGSDDQSFIFLSPVPAVASYVVF